MDGRGYGGGGEGEERGKSRITVRGKSLIVGEEGIDLSFFFFLCFFFFFGEIMTRPYNI